MSHHTDPETLSLTLLAVNIAMRNNSALSSMLPTDITFGEIGELSDCFQVQIHMDKQALASHTARILRRRRVEHEYSWAVEKGATNYMLSYFFPEVHSSEKASMVRAALKTKLLKCSTQISEQDSKIIYDVWVGSPLLSEFERVKKIFSDFKNRYDLGAICKNIKEFGGFKS